MPSDFSRIIKAEKKSDQISKRAIVMEEMEKVVEELRRFSFVKRKQKTWVSTLNDRQLYALFKKIEKGESAKSIAKYVQHFWKVNPDSSVHSVSQGILKFRKRIDHLLQKPETKDLDRNILQEQFNLDPVQSLETNERIAERLRNRIEKMMAEERDLNVIYPTLSRDVQALSTLQKTIMKQKEFQIKNEFRDPLKLLVEEKNRKEIEGKFQRLMDRKDIDHDRLLKATQKFLELAEEKSLLMIETPNGKYRLEKPE